MKVLHQPIIAQAPDRFYGWPANCGMWSWTDPKSGQTEILLGMVEGYHLADHGQDHAIDRTRASHLAFARSLDGGITWTIEHPYLRMPDVAALNNTPPDEEGDNAFIPMLDTPIDFSEEGFAMMFQNMSTHYPSRSWFYYTYDKGLTWKGPYRVPMFCRAMSMRTDYTVLDKDTLFLGMTGSRKDGFEGVCFAAKLTNGGLKWERLGNIGEEPVEDGFRIMPSTCRLPDGSYVCATRYCIKFGVRRLEIFRSEDEGLSWTLTAKLGDSCAKTAGNPPAMCVLPDGRLLVVYGKRDAPHGMIAHTSSDGGYTWSEPFYLRSDSDCADLGYPRMIVRPDGIAVAAYYYSHSEDSLRFIGGTVFDPCEDK